jgi:hypothetical protein
MPRKRQVFMEETALPTTPRRLPGHKMLVPKDEWERKIFLEFAVAARIDVDSGSVSSGSPPHPDIRYTVAGVERWAELVEITDQDLAKNHMMAVKTGAITGGAFSQRAPLERSILSKAAKSYNTNGSRLDLVAYYDKQFPAVSVEPDLIPQAIGHMATEMLASGVWTRIWVYDTWKKTVLWVCPAADEP